MASATFPPRPRYALLPLRFWPVQNRRFRRWGPTVEARLQKLEKLRASGVITSEEVIGDAVAEE